jgi:acyl-CoA synthetase (AMP-forming)/AMP-acid ligase II
MPHATLGSVVRENARSAPDRCAVVCGAARITHAELDDRTDRLASALSRQGVEPGDWVAWLGQNCHRWLELLIAAGKVGAVLCSLNWRQPASALVTVLSDLRPRLVFWQEHELGQPASDVRANAAGATWIGHDDVGDSGYEALLAAAPIAAPGHVEDPDDPVLAMCVTGGDGDTPVSMLSHNNLLVPGWVLGPLQWIDASTVNLASAPLFHIASLFTIVPTLQCRGTNVMVARADPEQICKAIEGHRCTHGFLLGPTAEAIVDLNAGGQYDLHTFRSALSIPAWQAMVTNDDSPWGHRTGGYGQTETSMALLAALGGEDCSSTSGRAAPYAEVRVVDDAGMDLAVGEVGEIVVRGPSVHRGYWERPELNSRRFRGGWWHTHDLGRRNADGSVTFVAPMGRMLKSGAENVYASEVERCLLERADVLEAAVIGIPDDKWIQKVMAVVVLRPDTAASEEELSAHCRQRLAPFKIPRSYALQFVPLPRDGGAVDYAALDAAHGGGNYPGSDTRST